MRTCVQFVYTYRHTWLEDPTMVTLILFELYTNHTFIHHDILLTVLDGVVNWTLTHKQATHKYCYDFQKKELSVCTN